MSWTVFYAWQSDLPNNTNRGLILRALEAAVAQLGADGTVVEDPRVDHDTAGVAGSPDIERTIFEKIDNAAVFVCDVSLVTTDASARPSPNPNVLVELGYALRSLGAERVIMVMNKAFGGPELLPFDIRRKRVLTYDVPADATEKAIERAALKEKVVAAVRMSVDAHVAARPSDPDPSAALIEAMEKAAPTRRARGRAYVASLLADVDKRKPVHPESDEEVVAAIETTRGTVAGFLQVASSIATHDPEDVVEEILHLFEGVLARFELPAGFSGTHRRSDFDFFKFVGHELFVGFAAAYVKEEKWEALDRILRSSLFVTGTSRPDRHVFYDRVSQPTDILDVVRNGRLHVGRDKRVSIRADMLKERYESGELAALLPWAAFMEMDLILFLRGVLTRKVAGAPRLFWFPWSSIYLTDLPPAIMRAVSQKRAARLATALGGVVTPTLGTDIKAAIDELREAHRAAWWDPPGEDFDWSRIATV